MKRFVFALSALAMASGASYAQQTAPATVTVYGIVDAGVTHTTGLATEKNQVVSGIMEGSRFGLRGNEDLGGGYRALFTLEHRLELNTGTTGNRPPSGAQVPDRLLDARLLAPALCPAATPVNPATGLPVCPAQAAVSGVASSLGATLGVNLPGRFWDRQAYLGLVTPFGAVLLGRQYTPAYEINAAFDVMGTQSALSAGQVASIPASVDIRVSNALQYRIVLGGLTASAMYSFGDPATVATNSKANRFGGAMAMYKTDVFSVGVGYNQRNNDIGQKSLKSMLVGASANLGPGTVSLLAGEVEDDNPSGVSQIGLLLASPPNNAPALVAGAVQAAFTEALKQDGTLMHIGYKWPMGGNTLYVAYSAYDDKRPANADVASYGVAYTYALSKRTDLNAVLVHFDNKNLAQAAPGQAGFLGGVTKSAGTDSNSLALGVRHRF
jgi:predicted porin